MDYVTRFAPSPTGRLHLGHAYSAYLAYGAAKAAGGRFLLRIEDIDQTRCRAEYEAGIFEDLAWLGLDWERPVRRQSDHFDDYFQALERLKSAGLLYRCFRTRREILDQMASAPHGPVRSYRSSPLPAFEEASRLEAGEAFAWRLSLDRAREVLGAAFYDLSFLDVDLDGAKARVVQADPCPHGDVVLARKDVGVAYHLAVVVDDALQGVTEVVRGEDLKEAAHIQRLLQALLGLPTPRYRHHPLIVGPDGARLAKRVGSQSLLDLRTSGLGPEAVLTRLNLSFPT